MPNDTDLEIAARAAQGFGVLQCLECAAAIEKALLAAGFHGRRVEIKGAGGREFMVCFSYADGSEAITETGWHMGIRVQDIVFDNLHPDGMLYSDWLDDFDAPGGIKVIDQAAS